MACIMRFRFFWHLDKSNQREFKSEINVTKCCTGFGKATRQRPPEAIEGLSKNQSHGRRPMPAWVHAYCTDRLPCGIANHLHAPVRASGTKAGSITLRFSRSHHSLCCQRTLPEALLIEGLLRYLEKHIPK
jgi:hypothetical protein